MLGSEEILLSFGLSHKMMPLKHWMLLTRGTSATVVYLLVLFICSHKKLPSINMVVQNILHAFVSSSNTMFLKFKSTMRIPLTRRLESCLEVLTSLLQATCLNNTPLSSSFFKNNVDCKSLH